MMFFKKNIGFKTDLFDESGFYEKFMADLTDCKREVIIESPYITSSRMDYLRSAFDALISRDVKVYIITRDPIEHEERMRYHATNEILKCKEIGLNMILLHGNHHRKIAIIDRNILWEGSLNILSQNTSIEIMRRTESKQYTSSMFDFLNYKQIIIRG
jgi:hypothetical protein